MYTPSCNIETPDVEIVCPTTGESYVYIEGDDLSLIDPKLHNGAVDVLPKRFFTPPWMIKSFNGQMRVFWKPE